MKRNRPLTIQNKCNHKGLLVRLSVSRYIAGYCQQILKAGIKQYQAQVERGATPRKHPLHRRDSFHKQQSELANIASKKSWYRHGGCQTTIFIPPIPSTELANEFREMVATSTQERGCDKDEQLNAVECS